MFLKFYTQPPLIHFNLFLSGAGLIKIRSLCLHPQSKSDLKDAFRREIQKILFNTVCASALSIICLMFDHCKTFVKHNKLLYLLLKLPSFWLFILFLSVTRMLIITMLQALLKCYLLFFAVEITFQ